MTVTIKPLATEIPSCDTLGSSLAPSAAHPHDTNTNTKVATTSATTYSKVRNYMNQVQYYLYVFIYQNMKMECLYLLADNISIKINNDGNGTLPFEENQEDNEPKTLQRC